jgi:hexosaminidase
MSSGHVQPIRPLAAGTGIRNCTVFVSSDDTVLALETDESYILDTTSGPTVAIKAQTVYGALRALESFSQLVDRGVTVTSAMISDSPRFQYRGFMIDTARHFYPMNLIYQHLDAMAYSKLNVLHWHIVDNQSFPYQSVAFPEMSREGAYTQRHVYTQDDIQSIINYARNRGIRVLVEFDTPGHVQRGYEALNPPILTPCTDRNKALNPTLPETYAFLDKLYDEIKTTFLDKYVHIGGDEVVKRCWKENAQITQWMKEHPEVATYEDLEQYFVVKLLDIIKKKGFSYMVWQEIFDNGAKILPDTVVEVWKWEDWQDEMAKVTKAGFHTVLSAPYYLNLISYGADWKKYYQIEPADFEGGSDAEKTGLMSGIEVCMWSEYIDATNFISRAWPRSSAVAERAWSPKEVNDVEEAQDRLHEFRCKLVSRGIQAEPSENGANMTALAGKNFCQDEWNPRYVAPWV